MRKNIIIVLCILTLAFFVSCSDSGSENSSIKSAGMAGDKHVLQNF